MLQHFSSSIVLNTLFKNGAMSHLARDDSQTGTHGDHNTNQATTTDRRPTDVIITSTHWVTVSQHATQDLSTGPVTSTTVLDLTSTATSQQTNSAIPKATSSATVASKSSGVKAYTAVQTSAPNSSGLSCAEQVTIPSVICGVEFLAICFLIWRQFGRKFHKERFSKLFKKNTGPHTTSSGFQSTEMPNAHTSPDLESQPGERSREQAYGAADEHQMDSDMEYGRPPVGRQPDMEQQPGDAEYQPYRGHMGPGLDEEDEDLDDPEEDDVAYQSARDTYVEPVRGY